MIEPHSTPAGKPEPQRPGRAKAVDKAQREKVERQLDEALADSFPASDPVSIVTSQQEEESEDRDRE
jgi:hypothetical protein